MNTRQSSKKEWTLERKNALMGYIMVSPILVGILLFTVVPVFFSLYISFTDWDMLHPQTWVGLQNYQTIFSDEMKAQIEQVQADATAGKLDIKSAIGMDNAELQAILATATK